MLCSHAEQQNIAFAQDAFGLGQSLCLTMTPVAHSTSTTKRAFVGRLLWWSVTCRLGSAGQTGDKGAPINIAEHHDNVAKGVLLASRNHQSRLRGSRSIKVTCS